MTKYLEISIEVTPLYSDFISEILESFGCNEIIVSEEYFSGELEGIISSFVKAYLPINESVHLTINSLKKELRLKQSMLLSDKVTIKDIGSWEIRSKEVNEEDWSESWKQFWHPMKIGQNITVCPSWEVPPKKSDEDIIIQLDPGSAFGTGTHQTTRLCIQSLEKVFSENDTIQTVLDVGTGSGILSIVAAKLGAKHILGIDIDPVSIEVSKQNAVINSVSAFCTFEDISIKKLKDEYDLVVVNILAKTILSMSDDIKRVTRRKGILILSGLISSTVKEITGSFEDKGFDIIDILSEDDWHAIIAIRD